MRAAYALPLLVAVALVSCHRVYNRNAMLGLTDAVASVEDSVYDFGTVNADEAPRRHVFRITNSGRENLIVHSVDVSCGCVTVDYDKSPTVPGGSLKLGVTFNAANKPAGFFRQQITVFTSAATGGKINLAVTGEIKQKH